MIRSTWTIPLMLAVLSLIGLIAALAGSGAADALSWLGLGLPVLATAWAVRVQRC